MKRRIIRDTNENSATAAAPAPRPVTRRHRHGGRQAQLMRDGLLATVWADCRRPPVAPTRDPYRTYVTVYGTGGTGGPGTGLPRYPLSYRNGRNPFGPVYLER